MSQVSPKDISWKDLDSLVAKRSRLRSGDEVIAISSQTKKPYLARISDIIGRSNPERKAEQQVGRLRNNLDRMLEDAVTKGETIIKGGYIETDLINVDELFAKNASITNTLTMGENGEITNVDGDYSLRSEGFFLKESFGFANERSIRWIDSNSDNVAELWASDTGFFQVRSKTDYDLHIIAGGELQSNGSNRLRTGGLINLSTNFLTLSGGVIDLTSAKHSLYRVRVESGASDDLDTINIDGGSPESGDIFYMTAEAGETIQVREVGNITTNAGNVNMDENTLLQMIYINGSWHLLHGPNP